MREKAKRREETEGNKERGDREREGMKERKIETGTIDKE